MDYESFREAVSHVKSTYGLYNSEYASIIGMSLSEFNARLFSKRRSVSEDTADRFLSPFKFHDPFIPELFRKPVPTPQSHISSDYIPDGWVPIAPLRDEVLKFKDENDSSWNILAEHFGFSCGRTLNVIFVGNHSYRFAIRKSTADRIRREIRKANSLSEQRRKEIFGVKRPKIEEIPTERLKMLLASAKQSLGCSTWKELAAALDVNYASLRSTMASKYKTVKPGIYKGWEETVRGALIRKDKQVQSRNSMIDHRFDIA